MTTPSGRPPHPPATEPALDEATEPPGRGRRIARVLGFGIAILAVPFGLTASSTAAWLGNCKWGFFGDYGPSMGAADFTIQDLGVQSIGLLIAVLPWGLIAWRTSSPSLRRTALVVIGCSCLAIGALVLLPQLASPEAYWDSVC